MHFTRRFAKVNDLKWCSEILEDGFEQHPDLRRKLPEIWMKLIAQGALTVMVIEDQLAKRPVAFGAGVIVSDYFANLAREAREPHLSVRLLQNESRQTDLQILRPEQIRKINHPAHGANFVILHYSEVVHQYRSDELLLIRDKSVGVMLELQSGYALKEILYEFYGEEDLPYCMAMGMNLRSSYDAYYSEAKIARPVPRQRPFLVGLNKSEVPAKWGTVVASLFTTYSAPSFFFTVAQQTVLRRALIGESDDEIASRLGITKFTIKDHWKAIFDRVSTVQQNWRGDLKPLPEPDATGSRNLGIRLRGRLLRYLNEHPSELRPADPKRIGASQKTTQWPKPKYA